jgi:enoyl-CoA hydratase/carnithine racemase
MSVTAKIEDRVGWITLDRPPANSYDPEFLEALDEGIAQVAGAGVAVGVVRSASERFFSAGADVKGFLERSAEENLAMARRAHQVLDRFDRLVAADQLERAVGEIAAGLAGGAPLAVAAVKRAVRGGLDRPLADGLQEELRQLALLFASEDAREGMMAFTEKRPPEYAGR